MRQRGSLFLALFFVLSFGAGLALAAPSSGADENKPPEGTWGESLKDGNDKGLKKATGHAYNYTHIAISCVVFAIIGVGLVFFIRHHTADRD